MNFYQRFIQVFSDIAQPLFDLIKKGVAWTWTAAWATMFQALKDAVTVEPVLVLSDESWSYWLEADSRKQTINRLHTSHWSHPVSLRLCTQIAGQWLQRATDEPPVTSY
jgi:hypothetical protein